MWIWCLLLILFCYNFCKHTFLASIPCRPHPAWWSGSASWCLKCLFIKHTIFWNWYSTVGCVEWSKSHVQRRSDGRKAGLRDAIPASRTAWSPKALPLLEESELTNIGTFKAYGVIKLCSIENRYYCRIAPVSQLKTNVIMSYPIYVVDLYFFSILKNRFREFR